MKLHFVADLICHLLLKIIWFFSIWNYPVYANTVKELLAISSVLKTYCKHFNYTNYIQNCQLAHTFGVHGLSLFLLTYPAIRFNLWLYSSIPLHINQLAQISHTHTIADMLNGLTCEKTINFARYLILRCLLFIAFYIVRVYVCVCFIFRSLFRKQVKPKLSYGYNNKTIGSLWSRQNATGGKSHMFEMHARTTILINK